MDVRETAANFLEEHVGFVSAPAVLALMELLAKDDSTRGIGDNSAAANPFAGLTGDAIRVWLEDQNTSALARASELIGAFDRFIAMLNTTEGMIPDDEVLGRAAAFEAQLRGHIKEVDTAREAARKPILDAGKLVQGFFVAHMIDPLTKCAATVQEKRTAYLNAKAEAERKRREDAAKAQEAEAARLAALAAETGDDKLMDAAIAAEDTALSTRASASVKPAEMARTHSDLGVTSSLRRTLKFRVIDKAKVPLSMMQVVDTAVLAAGRVDKDPTVTQPVAGIEFYYEAKAR